MVDNYCRNWMHNVVFIKKGHIDVWNFEVSYRWKGGGVVCAC